MFRRHVDGYRIEDEIRSLMKRIIIALGFLGLLGGISPFWWTIS
jgi:hypothetical protein